MKSKLLELLVDFLVCRLVKFGRTVGFNYVEVKGGSFLGVAAFETAERIGKGGLLFFIPNLVYQE
jgi:hypothetical protein